MVSGEIHHLRYGLIIAFLSAIGASAAIYYNEILLAMGAIGLVMIACLYAYISHLVFAGELQASLQAFGSFMRGMLDARLEVRLQNRVFSHLQYRCNNLLDVIDYHVRGDNAGFDTSEDNAYLKKLKATGLYGVLKAKHDKALNPGPDEVIVLPSPRSDDEALQRTLYFQAEEIAALTMRQGMLESRLNERVAVLQLKLLKMHKALERADALMGKMQPVRAAMIQNSAQSVKDAQFTKRRLDECVLAVQKQAEMIDVKIEKAKTQAEQLQNLLPMLEETIGTVHGVAGQAHMLALTVSNAAIRASNNEGGMGDIADDVKALAAHGGQVSALVRAQFQTVQASVEQAVDSFSEICAAYTQSQDEQLEPLLSHARYFSELGLEWQRNMQALASQEKTLASDNVLAETLEALVALCRSIERDVQLLQNKGEGLIEKMPSFQSEEQNAARSKTRDGKDNKGVGHEAA